MSITNTRARMLARSLALRNARSICVKWRDLMRIIQLEGPPAARALGVKSLEDGSIAAGEYRNADQVIHQIDEALK